MIDYEGTLFRIPFIYIFISDPAIISKPKPEVICGARMIFGSFSAKLRSGNFLHQIIKTPHTHTHRPDEVRSWVKHQEVIVLSYIFVRLSCLSCYNIIETGKHGANSHSHCWYCWYGEINSWC